MCQLVAEFSSFANSEEKKRTSNVFMSFPKLGNQMGSFGRIRQKIVMPLLSADSRYLRIYALKTCIQFLQNIVIEKNRKTVSDTFFRLNEIRTTWRESDYLRITNKRFSLLHNNSAQMLTRQEVKYCPEREFDATFQFYQSSLLVAR